MCGCPSPLCMSRGAPPTVGFTGRSVCGSCLGAFSPEVSFFGTPWSLPLATMLEYEVGTPSAEPLESLSGVLVGIMNFCVVACKTRGFRLIMDESVLYSSNPRLKLGIISPRVTNNMIEVTRIYMSRVTKVKCLGLLDN